MLILRNKRTKHKDVLNAFCAKHDIYMRAFIANLTFAFWPYNFKKKIYVDIHCRNHTDMARMSWKLRRMSTGSVQFAEASAIAAFVEPRKDGPLLVLSTGE